MSKTERDLAGDSVADALDDMFDDTDFDEALDDALDEADDSVPIRRPDEARELNADDTGELSPPTGETPADADYLDRDPTGETDRVEASHVDSDDRTEADADSDVAELAADDPTDAHDVGSDSDDHTDSDAEPDAVDTDQVADHDEAADADLDEAEALDAESADDSDEYALPEIIPATPDGPVDEFGEPIVEHDEPADAAEHVDAEHTEPAAFVEPLTDDEELDELDPDEVADEILEELRRADIDGPQVEMAPQDETTAARRRPRRAVDYDPAPVPIPARVPRVLGRKPRVRKVTRVVRHVDPWSVFKIAIVANLVLYVTLLTSGVLLWNVAHATGTVDNVERFFESFGWESFEFRGGEIYHAAWIAGLFGVIGLTGFAVLLATLFNLITDLVGGVRFTVLEEEVIETRTSPLRRFVVRRPEPEVPAVVRDASGAMVREAVVDDTGANARPSR